MFAIRKATVHDLDFLTTLETLSFDATRRFNETTLRRSLLSKTQSVFLIEANTASVGAVIVRHYSVSWRIYSLAVLPDYRGFSYGRKLVEHVIETARHQNVQTITLEVEASNIKLIAWYESFGFLVSREIKAYYGELRPAYKMALIIEEKPVLSRKITNWVVVDQTVEWLVNIPSIEIVSALDFIGKEKFQNLKGVRIFNLCHSYAYQTIGYYVSLLATARNQRVIPNVTTIKDFSDALIIESIGDEIHELIQRNLANIRSSVFTLAVYFGQTDLKKYSKLAKALYKLFEAPLLEFVFEKGRDWNLRRVQPLSLNVIEPSEELHQAARNFFNQKRFSITRFKDYKYDLAILIDPEENAPPSCKIALSKFKHASEKIGFYTEFITKDDYSRLSEFDALFIRMTTNVNDYSYQFSRYAYAEGLIVIDDPWSIFKCSNKLYLAESMKKAGVLTPKTLIVSAMTPIEEIISALSFPIVLKQPDSAFSLGVFKVHSEVQLHERLAMLFETSELLVAQAFIQSDFDWRIGILDNTPLFACKYYMAKNHWQVINWNSKARRHQVGHVTTLSIEDVPKFILDAAIKAAALIGDGLYGVDIKEINGQAIVIEVNDNPNVDYHWEDRVLEDQLYQTIMRNIYHRIETARNVKRKIS